MKKIIFILFTITCAIHSSKSQVTVSLAWEKDTIQLGEEVGLHLSILKPSGNEIVSVSSVFLDSIISGFQTAKMRQLDSTKSEDFGYADVDILDFGKFSTTDDNQYFEGSELGWDGTSLNNQEMLINPFKLRIWEPGQIIAISPAVKFQSQGNLFEQLDESNAILYVKPPVDVASQDQDSIGISPIKTIIKEPAKLSDYLIYIYVVAGILTIWLALWLYNIYSRKKMITPLEQDKVVIPAHDIALQKLHHLDDLKLWQAGNIKGYQSELTFIIREYVENKFEIKALELTTDEIVNALKSHLVKNHVSQLMNILQVADLVKFAKSKPKVNIHQEFMEKAMEFVRQTKNEQSTNGDTSANEDSQNKMVEDK